MFIILFIISVLLISLTILPNGVYHIISSWSESLLLDFFHQGCFDTFEKPVKLNLTKTNNKIVAEYNGVKYTLTPSQVDLFRQFEIELRSNHCGWCSSEDTYNLFNSKSYEIYGVKDSSGQWRGFNNLIKTLTGEK